MRGHIRLEHEMKIHMDYLDGKIEGFNAQLAGWETEKIKLTQRLETSNDKFKLYKE